MSVQKELPHRSQMPPFTSQRKSTGSVSLTIGGVSLSSHHQDEENNFVAHLKICTHIKKVPSVPGIPCQLDCDIGTGSLVA